MTENKHPLIPTEFLDAMNAVLEGGIKNGRVADDWKSRDQEGRQDRLNAIQRHWMAHVHEDTDEDNLAAIACNAMIVWWLENIGGNK